MANVNPENEKEERETHRLRRLRVLAVGLVDRPANRRPFFLRKREEKEGTMPEEVVNETIVDGETFFTELEALVRKAFADAHQELKDEIFTELRTLFKADPKAALEKAIQLLQGIENPPPAVKQAIRLLTSIAEQGYGYGYPQPAQKHEDEEEVHMDEPRDMHQKQILEEAQPALPPDIQEQLEALRLQVAALQEENVALRKALEDREREAERIAREARFREWLEKAEELSHLAVDPRLLAQVCMAIDETQPVFKSEDGERTFTGEDILAILKAVDEQAKTAQLFAEMGQQPTVTDQEAKILKALETGDFSQVSQAEAMAYLMERWRRV